MQPRQTSYVPVSVYFQWISAGILFIATIAAFAGTIAGLLGVVPMLTLPLQFGDVIYPQAGTAIQVGFVVMLIAICSTLPSGFRVRRLETSHRDFSICMSDVAEAYQLCHAADREGIFHLGTEYDAVKERILYLRSHPDLHELEPEILEAAAEMSYASRELAEIYSDENVSRARGFLKHREEEIALFEDKIDRALSISRELRRQKEAVEVEEAAMENRMNSLEDEFGELLKDLGFARSRTPANVISLPHATAAE